METPSTPPSAPATSLRHVSAPDEVALQSTHARPQCDPDAPRPPHTQPSASASSGTLEKTFAPARPSPPPSSPPPAADPAATRRMAAPPAPARLHLPAPGTDTQNPAKSCLP